MFFFKTYPKLNKSLVCYNVELPGIVKQAKILHNNEQRLNHCTNFLDKTNYDIIYFGSSIQ